MLRTDFFKSSHKKAIFTGLLTALCLFMRNILHLVFYSFAFYPDSNLYVQLGRTFFTTGSISPLVMFPYPLLNALTGSYHDPYFLLVTQIILASAAGGFLVYVIARKNLVLSWMLGLFFLIDLIWGSLSRAVLTDGMFATFFVFCLAVLVLHYDRRDQLAGWEIFLAGMLYSFACIIRPSHAFLVILLPGLYLWLTRSWKKMLILTTGIASIFVCVGLINLRGQGKFYIFARGTSYTDVNTAFPLFVYGLFSPDNGPVSNHLDKAIQQCYPGLDYQSSVERSEGGAVDSLKNMDFVYHTIIPCLLQTLGSEGLKGQFPRAYLEALISQPLQFTKVMYQENIIFLRYNNPYVLRLNLTASKNYGCQNIPWCITIRQTRLEWTTGSSFNVFFERTATKILQAYLLPIRIITYLSPEKTYLPYAVAWLGMVAFVILAMRGRNLFLAISAIVIIQFTSLVVVAGHGFTERYASMLSPIQTTLSGLIYYTLIDLLIRVFRRWKKPRLSSSSQGLI